jgi:hypothetical protein
VTPSADTSELDRYYCSFHPSDMTGVVVVTESLEAVPRADRLDLM